MAVGGEQGKLAGQGCAVAGLAKPHKVGLAYQQPALQGHAPGSQFALADREPDIAFRKTQVEGRLPCGVHLVCHSFTSRDVGDAWRIPARAPYSLRFAHYAAASPLSISMN